MMTNETTGRGKSCFAFWNALGFVFAWAWELIGLALVCSTVILLLTDNQFFSWINLAIGLTLTGLFHHVWRKEAPSE